MLDACSSQLHQLKLEPPSLPTKPPPPAEEISLSSLETLTTLGVGGFGRVTLVKHHSPTQMGETLFALKVLSKAHVRALHQQEHVLNERRILMECRSDFIVRMERTFRDDQRVYMLMEYCPGGELWTMLRNWGHFDEPTTRFYCGAALEALEYLHDRFIIYRDLKPENVMLDANGIPKLIDFGFAKRLDGPGCKTWTFCGTAEYISPEVILNRGQDTSVDLWGLGVFAYELLTGQPPFASSDPLHTYAAILRGVRVLAWPRHVSEPARSFITKLCKREPSQRLGSGSAEEIRKDGWMRGLDFEGLKKHTLRPPIKPRLKNATDTQNFQRFSSSVATDSDEDEEVGEEGEGKDKGGDGDSMDGWDEEF